MFFLVGSLLVSSFFIYKYRDNVTYKLLQAFSYIEDYIPRTSQNTGLDKDSIYLVNYETYSLEDNTYNDNTDYDNPLYMDEISKDLVFVTSGKIFNSSINPYIIPESDNKSIQCGTLAGVSLEFKGLSTSLDLDITELVNNLSLVDHSILVNTDNLKLFLILYNEFYDGNLLIEELIRHEPKFTIVTVDGNVISLNAINLNITI